MGWDAGLGAGSEVMERRGKWTWREWAEQEGSLRDGASLP